MVVRIRIFVIVALLRTTLLVAECDVQQASCHYLDLEDETSLLQVKKEVTPARERVRQQVDVLEETAERKQKMEHPSGSVDAPVLLGKVSHVEKARADMTATGEQVPAVALDAQRTACPGCPGGFVGPTGYRAGASGLGAGGYYTGYALGAGYIPGATLVDPIAGQIAPGFGLAPVAGISPGIGQTVVTDSASVVVPGSGAYAYPGAGAAPVIVQPPYAGAAVAPLSPYMPVAGGVAVAPGVAPNAAIQAARADTERAYAQNAATIAEDAAARASVQQANAQNIASVAVAQEAAQPFGVGYQYYYPQGNYGVQPASQHVHYHIVKDYEGSRRRKAKDTVG